MASLGSGGNCKLAIDHCKLQIEWILACLESICNLHFAILNLQSPPMKTAGQVLTRCRNCAQ
jgi:hypothetical protein